MSWQIKKEKNKYRIYSTIVDEYVTDWMTKDETLTFLFWYKFNNFLSDCVEEFMCFPYKWRDEDGRMLDFDEKKVDEFYELKKGGQELPIYMEFLTKLKEMDIQITMRNKKGDIQFGNTHKSMKK